jgi:glyceraldehyde-3-phosphate dehydrogenase (NADP+)
MNLLAVEERIKSIFHYEPDIPDEFRLNAPVIQREYLIDGELRIWQGPMQEVLTPIYIRTMSGLTQKVAGSYPWLTKKEALEALQAAVQAYNHGKGLWPSMTGHERIERIRDFLFQMESKKMEIVKLLMWETGKTYDSSLREFERTVDYVNKIIFAMKDLSDISSGFIAEQGVMGQIRHMPLGVVLCMGPFNYPLFETFTTLIPALVMGNTVVLKPPKIGVLLHYPMLTAFQRSFPPGVVNTIYGEPADLLPPLMSTGKIDCLAFIGSVKVADMLKSRHPKPHRLRSVLGLEAKNPAVIMPDSDINLAAHECLRGSLAFNGQRCTALKILFVHREVADIFLNKCAELIGKLRFGMPWEKDVFITPLPEPKKTKYLTELLEDALECGARVMNVSGGTVNKTFFYPALIYPVNAEMRLYKEEQFGPLIPVVPFDNIEAPVEYIIQSRYGQQVSIFGNDPEAIADLTTILINQVCRVNINCKCQRGPDLFPFGGRKDSGEGSLSVADALKMFSMQAIVTAKRTEKNMEIITRIEKDSKTGAMSAEVVS